MRELILTETETEQPTAFASECGEVYAYSRRSPSRESESEDAAAIWELPEFGLILAVADGLGGAPSGAAASALAIQTLGQALLAPVDGGSASSLILGAFEQANRAVLDLGVGAGTTLIVAHIRDEMLRTYHVGDCAGIVVGQRGKLKLETISHSPVGYGVAAGLIDPDEALRHEERHFVLNYLGTNAMHLQVGSPLRLAPRDTVLLGSDGLFDNFLMGEILNAIRKGPLALQSSALAAACRERMTSDTGDEVSKPDDLTFILFRGKVGR